MRSLILVLSFCTLFCTACDPDPVEAVVYDDFRPLPGNGCSKELRPFKVLLTDNQGRNLVSGPSAVFHPDSVTLHINAALLSSVKPVWADDHSYFIIPLGREPEREFFLRLAPASGPVKIHSLIFKMSGKQDCYEKLASVVVGGGSGCSACSSVAVIKLPY